ncbi:hypothetical protein C4L39_26140 [Clostridium diolis]|uniref:hypothetical protein n=1 Tax=Clostridium diolis TaxID=223919 RepID=UPI000D137564|nr:hypothetical protein [Clostridium diolis]PSM54836.1 hypothetical protein C4L39_26140 [Clostridium diolis]
MAYPLNLNDIVSVTLEARLYGQQVMSVLHYEVIGPLTTEDGAAALDAFAVAINAVDGLQRLWAQCQTLNSEVMLLHLQKVASNRFARRTYAGGLAQGSVAGQSMPANVAAAITKRGETANRHNVGTIHMPGVPASWVTNGLLNEDAVEAYGLFALEMKSEQAPAGTDVIFSPVMFNRAAPLTSQTVVDTALKIPTRVMRRRTVGLGT